MNHVIALAIAIPGSIIFYKLVIFSLRKLDTAIAPYVLDKH